MFHSLFTLWFQLVHDWGYLGVFTLMAIESTVFPLPSEVVLPPAAYWAAQGRMHFWGVVAAGTMGSWTGSAISYFVARTLGRPLILRFGRYVFVPEKKWIMAEQWIQRYGGPGIFFARLLPVVRHLVSLPAGAARMSFRVFTTMTLLGSFSWTLVLTWFGARVLADRPNLMQDPEALAHVVKDKLLWFVVAVALMAVLYGFVEWMGRRLRREAAARSDAAEG